MNRLITLDELESGARRALTTQVSAIIVVYFTGSDLFECLSRALSDPEIDEVVIVDNGSTLEDAARLREIHADSTKVRLLQGHGNIGFARAANLGAAASKGQYLLILNPDAFLCDSAVTSMLTVLTTARAPAIVGARIVNPDGTEQRGGRRGEVTPVTSLLSLSRLAELVPAFAKYQIHREHMPLPPSAIDVPTISGACFAISRDVFFARGGFDTRYFLHVEDVDLCWRVRQNGGRVLFDPNARVIHVGHTSHAAPLFVEWNKGLGLVRYFFKRADTWERRLLTIVLAAPILLISSLRPLLNRRLAKLRPHRGK